MFTDEGAILESFPYIGKGIASWTSFSSYWSSANNYQPSEPQKLMKIAIVYKSWPTLPLRQLQMHSLHSSILCKVWRSLHIRWSTEWRLGLRFEKDWAEMHSGWMDGKWEAGDTDTSQMLTKQKKNEKKGLGFRFFSVVNLINTNSSIIASRYLTIVKRWQTTCTLRGVFVIKCHTNTMQITQIAVIYLIDAGRAFLIHTISS